jgi:hypothetical protein
MYSENGVAINLEELGKVIERCDVFTIGFQNFAQRLFVDTRSKGDVGPMVRMVEPVATVQERFHWLGQNRPGFGVPENFTFVIWPHSIRYMEASGVLGAIRSRLDAGGQDVSAQYEAALAELQRLERWSIREALAGDTYKTLWPREYPPLI